MHVESHGWITAALGNRGGNKLVQRSLWFLCVPKNQRNFLQVTKVSNVGRYKQQTVKIKGISPNFFQASANQFFAARTVRFLFDRCLLFDSCNTMLVKGLLGDFAADSEMSLSQYLYTSDGAQSVLLPSSLKDKFALDDLTGPKD